MSFVLIIAIYSGIVVSLAVAPQLFSSEDACIAAGEKAKSELYVGDRTNNKIRYSCVPKG